MKSLFTIFAFIGLTTGVIPAVQAVTSYGITIAGVSVTSDNACNVTGGGIPTTAAGSIDVSDISTVITLMAER